MLILIQSLNGKILYSIGMKIRLKSIVYSIRMDISEPFFVEIQQQDPHFTLAHHGVSSSSVVRASDLITEGRGFQSLLEHPLDAKTSCC